jgi:biopolymer transport protein ExbD
MKLQSSLPHPPGFLYAIPLLNVFTVLLMCYVLGPSLEEKSGVRVQLPSSIFQLERVREAAVITMTVAGSSEMYLNTKRVSFTELEKDLDLLAEDGAASGSSIVIMADRLVSSDELRKVAEASVLKGFRVVLAGGSEPQRRDRPKSGS